MLLNRDKPHYALYNFGSLSIALFIRPFEIKEDIKMGMEIKTTEEEEKERERLFDKIRLMALVKFLEEEYKVYAWYEK